MDRKWFLRLLGLGGINALLPDITGLEPGKQEIIKPKSLNKGDTIGLISPSSRLPEKHLYDQIVRQIQELGFIVKEGQNARKRYGYLGGTDEERAADLNAMFADDAVDAIMPFRGGWGANRILHLIDYDLIRSNPKILVGFSDISSLLMAIFSKTGLISFHGPVGKSDWTDYTVTHFRRMLSGSHSALLDTTEKGICGSCDHLKTITPGRAEGRLLGGNLSVISAMVGSDFLPGWRDNILFIEDVGEDIYRIDRMITQLKISGILEQLSGFIFGQCTDCEGSNEYSLTLQQVFDDHIKPLDIPAYSGAMFGHISNMLTLPVGLKAEMNARDGTLKFAESAVKV